MTDKTLANHERGDSIPDASVLASYHAHFGVNITWLVTGGGDMFADLTKAPLRQVAPELMERLHDKVSAVFKEIDQKPPQRRITREAANLYNELMSAMPDVSDTEMLEIELSRLALKFKRQLQAAAPGSGKRTAL